MYANNNGLLRMRVLKRLPKDKQELRRLLARLGIRNLRPVDIAWNYVVFYNEKIRQLWNDCNLRDPDERRRVMRQILELDEKREQRLAEANQSPDCYVKFWMFPGWNRAEYDEVFRAVQAERIEKSKPVEQHEPAEQQPILEEQEPPVTQPGSTTAGLLDDINGCSEPMSSFEPSGETSFDSAFENTTASQEYDADRPSLDAFEKSLFATRSESKPGEDIIDDSDSLFGDDDDNFLFGVGDDDQLNTAPVSSLDVVEEANTAEKASYAPPVIQQASFEEVIDINDSVSDDPCFGDFDYHQSASAPAPGQAVEEAATADNVSHASPVVQHASTEKAIEISHPVPDDDPFGESNYHQSVSAPAPGQAVEEAHTAENLSHASPITTQGSLVEDLIETNQSSGSVSSVPDEGSQAEPAPALGQAAEKPLTCDTNTIADASANQQVSQEQQATELQQMPDQSDLADSQAGPQQLVPCAPLYRDLLLRIPDSHKGELEKLRQQAREELSPFWPDGKQNCSALQLDLYALGVVEFKQQELERYKLCQALGKHYVVEFQEEYEGIPPNMTLTPICNGAAWFFCLIQNNPGPEPENAPEFVDLTGDDDDSAMAALLDEPQPALAAPAEISAASEPARPTAEGQVVRKGRKAPRKSKKAAQKVDPIETPSPVDQATFTQSPASLTSNAEPTTPVNDGDAGDIGTWSSDWSGKAFSDGGQPPKTPTDQEVVVMERSVSDDNTMRKISPTDEAAGNKKSRRKARTGDGSGSVSSAQSAHAALQNQMSQSEQAPGPVAGASTTENTEQGKKRGRKNARATADTNASQRQQHGTPEQQQQPTPYYGVSPEHRADPKKWVEEYTQGGKGKKNQKRKAAEPKETPSPRKAQKTREVTPAAPRVYRKIAPAPPRNNDDAGDVQMLSRPGSPMDHDGTAPYSPDVQITGHSTPMQSAAPQMPHGQFMRPRIYQQPLQNAQQQQHAQPSAGPQNGWNNHMQQQPGQPPAGPQDGWNNHMQQQPGQPPAGPQDGWNNHMQQQQAQPPAGHMQQQHTSQTGVETVDERNARLQKELAEMRQRLDMKEKDSRKEVAEMRQQLYIKEKDSRIAELEQQLAQQQRANQAYPTSHGTWAPPQQGAWAPPPPPQPQGNIQPSQQGNWAPPPGNVQPPQQGNVQPSYHGDWAPPQQQGNVQPPQQGNWAPPQQQGNVQPPQQGNWAPPQKQGNAQPQVGEGSYETFSKFKHRMGQPPSQPPPMGAPQMMANQGMPANGTEPRPRNMHRGYWGPPPPAAEQQHQPMPNGFTPAGHPGTGGNFNQTTQGGNGQGWHGGC